MAQQANHALPSGFQLDVYHIEHQLSLGGFSIVYLATDPEGKFVAIKEYLPNSLALRGEGGIKPVISDEHMPAFRYGMKCFFEEGRALAKLSHPNVIRVLNFFRGNDTVYMAVSYTHLDVYKRQAVSRLSGLSCQVPERPICSARQSPCCRVEPNRESEQ